MKKTAQELGDQELPTNIENTPRANGEGGIKTMGRPGGLCAGESGESEDPPKKRFTRQGHTKPQPKARFMDSASWWPGTQK